MLVVTTIVDITKPFDTTVIYYYTVIVVVLHLCLEIPPNIAVGVELL